MSTKTEIANLTLSHLGIGKEIANVDTEKSEEAAAVRRYYDIALNVVFSATAWPFATRIAALALVATNPNKEWAYSYRYPSDCHYIRRILSGLRTDDRQSRIPYKIAGDAAGTLIFTDEQDATIEYTSTSDSTQFYPPDMVLAVSYYLAFLCAPRLTGGDQFRLGDRALKLYELQISSAKASVFNEEQPDVEPDNEFIRSRI